MYTLEISELQRRALERALVLACKHDEESAQESVKRQNSTIDKDLLEKVRNLKEDNQ